MDHHFSVDLIFIDFRQAFDTVPHQRLLKKLEFKEMPTTEYSTGLLREHNGLL